ncbi:Dephospho-CoA kinase [Campylobacter suis]|uniref:Dephospho-CoA kinase n=2 Tax=Campylobacter suis TaxID=2790657 RepID=A0ABN7K6L2_9BACT|nr:dephospho-CoA kinase [Campylobacter suis]CAD7288154.1 Dephospho-CoA kinase [Campylobacter suis]
MFKNGFVVTGSIGSGKSTFVNLLKNAGFSVIDADLISHEMLENSQNEVIKKFGSHILQNGKISRKKLGAIVFNDKAKLKELEKILHPKISAKIAMQSEILEQQKKPFFVDIPLFFEGLGEKNFDKIIVVYAPENLLIERVMKRNDLDYETAQSRVQLQIDIEIKKQMADFVIDNSGDLENLKQQTQEFLKNIKENL